jgi:hypothetical protein
MGSVLASLLGTGWASGVNLYATIVLLGLFGRFGVAETPEVLQHRWVLGVAAGMYALEFVADKVPVLDSVWDVAHTVIRPVGAALLGGELAGEDVSAVLGGGISGGMALGAHAVKAGARLAINTSPEPVTNIGVSLGEDLLVAVMVWFAVTYPWIAGAAAVLLLLAGSIVLVTAWKAVRSGLRRLRARRDQPTPST